MSDRGTTRWLIAGAGGMLANDLESVLAGEDVTAPTIDELDIRDERAVTEAVAGHDVVINAAAWTDVDGAETNEAAATEVNGTAVGVLARACVKGGATLLHVSTDYVFAGDATEPYQEYAPTAPINAYGRGKLVGERAALEHGGYLVRTSWLYGASGKSFVGTMLSLAERHDTVTVVDDQRGQPTWSFALAERLVALGRRAHAGTAPAGIYHGTSSGVTTWYELAREVFAGAGLDPDRVHPVSSAQFVRPARRPAYSVLGHDRWAVAGLTPLANWRTMLHDALPIILAARGG